MKKEIKFWILAFIVTALALGTQLLGQDAYDTPEERDREIQRQEQRENQSSKVVKTLQDWDFRKYEAAHKRAHMKMDKKNPRKDRYAYLLTPKGIREKSILTHKFIRRKRKEIGRIDTNNCVSRRSLSQMTYISSQ